MNLKDRQIDLIYDVVDNLMRLEQHEAISTLLGCIFDSHPDLDIDLAVLTSTLPIKNSDKITENRQKFLDRVGYVDKKLIAGLE